MNDKIENIQAWIVTVAICLIAVASVGVAVAQLTRRSSLQTASIVILSPTSTQLMQGSESYEYTVATPQRIGSTRKEKYYSYDGQSACIPVHEMPCDQIYPDGVIVQNTPDSDGKCWAIDGETIYPAAPTSSPQIGTWSCPEFPGAIFYEKAAADCTLQ
jgi:hypothetical protein